VKLTEVDMSRERDMRR